MPRAKAQLQRPVRTQHVDRRSRTDGDTDQHGQREAFQNRATRKDAASG